MMYSLPAASLGTVKTTQIWAVDLNRRTPIYAAIARLGIVFTVVKSAPVVYSLGQPQIRKNVSGRLFWKLFRRGQAPAQHLGKLHSGRK